MLRSFVEDNMVLWRIIYDAPAKDWLVILGILLGLECLKELTIVTVRYMRFRKKEKEKETHEEAKPLITVAHEVQEPCSSCCRCSNCVPCAERKPKAYLNDTDKTKTQ